MLYARNPVGLASVAGSWSFLPESTYTKAWNKEIMDRITFVRNREDALAKNPTFDPSKRIDE